MATQKYSNLAKTTLASNYTAADSTLVVLDSTYFPTSGDFIIAMGDPVAFFLKVTAVSGTTFTVTTSAQESYGSVASKVAGTAVTAVLTAGSFDSIRGEMINTGVVSSLPSTTGQKQGNLYLPTDQPMGFQFNGSIWASFGPLFRLTLPVLSSFTVDAQAGSTATVTDTGAGITVTGSSNQSSSYYRTGPVSTPFNITALVSGVIGNEDSGQFGIYGIETATNKRIDFVIQHATSNQNYTVNLFNSGPSFSSTAKQTPVAEVLAGNFYWLRIRDDGTNRLYQVSSDGINFLTYFSHVRASHATLDKFGFCATGSTNYPPCFRLWSWAQG